VERSQFELILQSLFQSLQNEQEQQAADLRRYVRLGDMQRAQMALGGELVCDVLRRRLAGRFETAARLRQEQEQKQRVRLIRAQQRELQKGGTREISEVPGVPGQSENQKDEERTSDDLSLAVRVHRLRKPPGRHAENPEVLPATGAASGTSSG